MIATHPHNTKEIKTYEVAYESNPQKENDLMQKQIENVNTENNRENKLSLFKEKADNESDQERKDNLLTSLIRDRNINKQKMLCAKNNIISIKSNISKFSHAFDPISEKWLENHCDSDYKIEARKNNFLHIKYHRRVESIEKKKIQGKISINIK